MRARAFVSAALISWSSALVSESASADSTKTTPVPGITHIHRTGAIIRGAVQDYHVVLVDLASPSLRLRVTKEADRGKTVSEYGASYGAHVAINASFLEFTDHRPCGTTESFGSYWTKITSGCTPAIAFDKAIATIFDGAGKATWPTSVKATDGVSAGPWLVKNGVNQGPFTDPASINTRKARTAIGYTKTGKTLIIVAADGEQPTAAGLTGNDLLLVFNEFAAYQALNLDGTGSTALFIASEGGLQNKPSEGKERQVANAILVVPDGDAGADASPDAADAAIDAAPSEMGVALDTGEESGVEDPTTDGGDPTDGSIYEGTGPGSAALPSAARNDDATGCACETVGRGDAEIGLLVIAGLAIALTRRGSRSRA
ncbi:MAG: phosphodiester glycosidase family protein [Polyangiales bacterium]